MSIAGRTTHSCRPPFSPASVQGEFMLRARRSNIPILVKSSREGTMTRTLITWHGVFLVILCGLVKLVCLLHSAPLYRVLVRCIG